MSGPASALRVRRHDGAPVVSVRVFLPGGSRLEPAPGVALVCGRSLIEGSPRRGWRQIAEEAESRGASFAAAGNQEGIHLAVDALADDWEWAVERAAELAIEPSFPADRVAWVARQAQAELAALEEEGEVRTSWLLRDQLYSPHPWGRPVYGDHASLARITAADCVAFHRVSLARGPVVSVAGRVEADRVSRALERRFGSLPASPPAAAVEPPPPGGGTGRREVFLPSGNQVHLDVGKLTVARGDPDLPALALLGVVLGAGAGVGGRIPTRVREREGLAYAAGVETAAGAGTEPGCLEVTLATSPGRTESALEAVLGELRRLVEEGVETAELAAAKRYLLGRLPFGRETSAQWSRLLIEAAFYGIAVDRPGWEEERIEAVDRSAIERAARRYLRPSGLAVAVGRPADLR